MKVNKAGSPPAAPADGLLSDYAPRPEMAAELGISPRTLARLDSLRQGPPRLVLGGRVLYHRPSAREWLRAQLQEQVAAPGRNGRR